MKPGPKPRGDHTLTPTERSAAFRARRKAAGLPAQVRHSRPVGWRSKQQKRWQDVVEMLVELLDNYLVWRDTQGGLTDSAIADRLEEALLRDLLARLAEAELPKGERAMSVAERSAAYRARRRAETEAAAPVVKIRYRRPADRRSRPARWQDAVETLADQLDSYQAWRDSLPAGLQDSEIADRLDELLHLRDAVDQLAAAELPKGFGRD